MPPARWPHTGGGGDAERTAPYLHRQTSASANERIMFNAYRNTGNGQPIAPLAAPYFMAEVRDGRSRTRTVCLACIPVAGAGQSSSAKAQTKVRALRSAQNYGAYAVERVSRSAPQSYSASSLSSVPGARARPGRDHSFDSISRRSGCSLFISSSSSSECANSPNCLP